MKAFIEHIQKSIYGPDYYREILDRPASFSWKYYGSFAMMLALIMTILYSIPIVPAVSNTLHDFPKNFSAYYPEELEVRIVNGHATTTAPEPYYLSLPQMFKSTMASDTDITSLGVIDTKSPPLLETFRGYHAFFWISANAIVLRDQDGGIRVNPFDTTLNYTVNKQGLMGIVGRIEPYFKFVAPMLVAAIFIAMLIAFAINLIYLAFSALFVWAMVRIMKRSWSYGTTFRVCLHATTLPLLMSVVLSLVNLDAGSLPFFSTILLLGVVYVNIKNMEPEQPLPAPAPLPFKA